MITTSSRRATRESIDSRRPPTHLLPGRRGTAAGLALVFALAAAFIATLLTRADSPSEELVRTEEGRLFAHSLQTLAGRRDAGGIESVCASAQSVLSGGPAVYARDWQRLSTVCSDARAARTPVEWTKIQIELRRLTPF